MGWYEKLIAPPWTDKEAAKFVASHKDVVKQAGFKVLSYTLGATLTVWIEPGDPECNCARLSDFDGFFGGKLEKNAYTTSDSSGKPVSFSLLAQSTSQ